MRVDVYHSRKIPFVYVSPAVCDYIFSASGEVTIFLDDRSRSGSITGLLYSAFGGVFRLSWDTYPGALCYTVYRLVDELDPFSEYEIIAECITDNFLDNTDPGAYFVTAITGSGETPFQSEPFQATGGVDPCQGNLPPEGFGANVELCLNTPGAYDVTDYNTDPEGQDLTLVSAVADVGAVATAGTVITYTPQTDYFGEALINYTVADPCGASLDNAILVTIFDDVELAEYSNSTCDDTPLVIDVSTLVSSGDDQSWTLTEASVDVGGSVEIDGTNITFTPTAAYEGASTITYTVQGECGKDYEGTLDITVTCGSCAFIGTMGVWSDLSSTSAIGGSATGSGNNEVATVYAQGDAYSDPFVPPPSPTVSRGWARVVKEYDGSAEMPCRATIEVSGSSGAHYVAVSISYGGSVISDMSWIDPGDGTLTHDFNVPASTPKDLQLDVICEGGRLTSPGFPFTVTAGEITATVTFGTQP